MYYNLALAAEILFVAVFMALSFKQPEEVRFYPQAVLVLMGLCALFTIISHIRSKPGNTVQKKEASPVAALSVFGLLGIYVATLNFVGYILGTISFFILWVALFNRRLRVSYAVSAVALALVMYFVFGKLFNVPLPEGLLAF